MWELSKDTGLAEKEMRVTFRETLECLMGENKKVLAFEADLGGASHFAKIKATYPDNFVQMGISEANMVGVAATTSMRGFVPFIHTFSPFASRRVADQVYLTGAYAQNTLNIFGSDPGICAAANGGTHTTFEDIALYRAIPEVQVFAPADNVQLEWLIKEVTNRKGVHYIRANRKAVSRIYQEGSTFEIGKGNVIRQGTDVLLLTMGVLVREALDAAEELEKEGISVEVIDMFTIKPLDKELILREMRGKKLVVTFENHNIINGLGSAVAEVMADAGSGIPLKRMGVMDRFGQVGSFDFLKEEYGLTKAHVKHVVYEFMK